MSCLFLAIDGNRIASNHLHGLVARQWADGGMRPTNSLMRLSMGTLMDTLFLQVLSEIHAERNVRYVRYPSETAIVESYFNFMVSKLVH